MAGAHVGNKSDQNEKPQAFERENVGGAPDLGCAAEQ
jgi:hypothetical protein